METTAWSAHMALGIPLFDEAHQAMAEQVMQLLDGPDHEVAAGMARLTEALEDDFRLEESLMEAIDYPEIRAHREQHARVLAALHRLAPGDVGAARAAAGLILPWFEMHLATADTALARALQAVGRARTGAEGHADLLAATA
nr:hemerythrin family protein [uncultured Duganella sp.]